MLLWQSSDIIWRKIKNMVKNIVQFEKSKTKRSTIPIIVNMISDLNRPPKEVTVLGKYSYLANLGKLGEKRLNMLSIE